MTTKAKPDFLTEDESPTPGPTEAPKGRTKLPPRPAPKSAPSVKGPGTSLKQLEDGLTSNLRLLGTMISVYDDFDGSVLIEKAPALSSALMEVAKANPAVKKALEKLLTTGAWGGFIMVLGMEVAMPIAVHHSALPKGINDLLASTADIPIREKKKASEKAPGGATGVMGR